MATESFYRNVVISDPKKIKELKEEMKKPSTAFLDVKPFKYPKEKDCKETVEEWLSTH